MIKFNQEVLKGLCGEDKSEERKKFLKKSGVSKQQLFMYLNDGCNPGLQTLFNIMEATNKRVADFVIDNRDLGDNLGTDEV